MKAVVYRQYGDPEVLSVQNLPTPKPGRHDLLIRVMAAEVAKSDCELRSFQFPLKWFWLPLRLASGVFKPRNPQLGSYFSGEVVAVGAGVSRLKVGDQVFGSTGINRGAYAEYLCVSAHACVGHQPEGIPCVEAAALPMGGLNALHFMNLAKLQPGTRLLINGAGGSIGCYGLQIAKARGADVTAIDLPHKEALLRSLGADHFVASNQVNQLNRLKPFDRIFDVRAPQQRSVLLSLLTSDGSYISANPSLRLMLHSLVANRRGHKKIQFAFARESLAELNELKVLCEQGAIRVPLDGVFSLSQIVAAHHRVESEQRLGLVVVQVASDTQSD